MELLCFIRTFEHARWRVIATKHHGHFLDESSWPRSGQTGDKVPSAISWYLAYSLIRFFGLKNHIKLTPATKRIRGK
jgi:hypothetical protein